MNFQKPRRSGRMSKSVPILLIGNDCEGRVFTENTHTVMLSYHGAGIVSRHILVAEQELVLRSLESQRETEIRVVGEIGSQGNLHTYGVAFLNEMLDFWRMEFPAPPSQPERPLKLTLECSGCDATVALLDGDFEFDICAIHVGLVRHCARCGFATVWKRTKPGSESRAVPVKMARKPEEKPRVPGIAPGKMELDLHEATEEAPPVERTAFQATDSAHARAQANATERSRPRGEHAAKRATRAGAQTGAVALQDRRRRRAKVNYFACVRSAAFGDDVVTCIDMSRGGLSFWTKNAYEISAQVTIAVPFSPESPNAPAIFVAARVVNVAEAPERKMFRCGVAFLLVAGSQPHT